MNVKRIAPTCNRLDATGARKDRDQPSDPVGVRTSVRLGASAQLDPPASRTKVVIADISHERGEAPAREVGAASLYLPTDCIGRRRTSLPALPNKRRSGH